MTLHNFEDGVSTTGQHHLDIFMYHKPWTGAKLYSGGHIIPILILDVQTHDNKPFCKSETKIGPRPKLYREFRNRQESTEIEGVSDWLKLTIWKMVGNRTGFGVANKFPSNTHRVDARTEPGQLVTAENLFNMWDAYSWWIVIPKPRFLFCKTCASHTPVRVTVPLNPVQTITMDPAEHDPVDARVQGLRLALTPAMGSRLAILGLLAVHITHHQQYWTNQDAVTPIHKIIRELELVSKTHSPFNSPIWPVRKSNGEWRLTVDYRALNEVTPPLSAAVPDMLELQYELESKAEKWYATIDIANAFFSIPLAAECRPQFAFTWRGVQYTWNELPQGWKHSPIICHGLIQAALERGQATLQYIYDIIVWGNTAIEVFEKGEKIIQILLEVSFAIKNKVKGPAQEIQFLGVKWQDGRHQIPTEVINNITTMSPLTSKKETQAFLGAIGFWRMHIPEYSQTVSCLYLVTRKKNDFHWCPECYRGSEANYTPTEKEILAAYEGVQAASKVISTEAQLLLAPWMFKGKVPSTHHTTKATWRKWIALITQRTRTGTPNRPGILDLITNWLEHEKFGLMVEEEQEHVVKKLHHITNCKETKETRYTLFTDGSCCIVGMNRKWKAAEWSSTRQVAQATEGEAGLSQLAELKAVQLALDIAEREKWPKLYLYNDSWTVANALWGWLKR
ncbi:hypothetical protein DUI87_16494 [Hirundo rustica rustica]|uniref:ribonuclease H n=1 Tax=Hirundo rustica rustica TaxID=333673 RepID=A0A3M0K3P5_HIRRU|nr:hypothetical protein DUI87_16494 [Hirundo rustica rustica]